MHRSSFKNWHFVAKEIRKPSNTIANLKSCLIRLNTILYLPLSLNIYECLVCQVYKWNSNRLKNHTHFHLTLSWWRPLSYRNQSTDLLCKSMDWFLYDNSLYHEKFKDSSLDSVTLNPLEILPRQNWVGKLTFSLSALNLKIGCPLAYTELLSGF